MSKPNVNRIVRSSLICLTLAAGLCGAAPPATHGEGGRGTSPHFAVEPPPVAAGQTKRCGEMTEHIPTDFSGLEYTGTVSYPKEGMYGDATLTVSREGDKQTFSLTAGGKTLTGRLSSETTCGYTAVALKFDDTPPPDPPQPPPPAGPSFSLRACEERSGAVLRSREQEDFNFTARGAAPKGAPGWGQCNRRGQLRGNRPL